MDSLKEFACGIVACPIGVQDSQEPTVAQSMNLRNRLKLTNKPQHGLQP